MKKLIYFWILIAFISINSNAQNNNPLHNWEVTVYNNTTDAIEVMLHPISAVFNGNYFYTLVAKGIEISNDNSYNYINGLHYDNISLKTKSIIDPNDFIGWNVDLGDAGLSSALGGFGYGQYKLIIKNLRTERVDSCLMEFDLGGLQQSDLFFYLYNDDEPNNYRFSYKFNWTNITPPNVNVPISYNSLRSYLAIPWEPNSFINNNHVRTKNFGNFLLKNYEEQSLNYNAEYFPLDSRIHCNYINPALNFFLAQNHAYPYPLEEPQSGYYDDRHGILNLNLTIKRRVVTPPYRSNFSVGNPNPTPIIVSPGVTLSVLRNEPTDSPNMDYMYNGIVLGKYYNDNVGADMIVKSANEKYSAGKLFLGPSTDNDSNNRVVINSYSALKLEPTSILELGSKAEIDIELSSNNTTNRGKLIAYNNSNIISHPESKIIARQVGEFENYGANFTNSNNFFIYIKDGAKYSIKAENYTHTVSNGAYIKLYNGNIEVAKNSSIVFDGVGSYLSLTNNSNIILGENAKIEFKNGAYLDANGGTISSLNASTPGKGLYFENAGGQTSITNCTFNNLTNSVYINNSVPEYVGTFKYLYGNTFNTNNNCNYVIETKNANNITISNNQINMSPGVGIGILMRYPSNLSEGEAASTPFTVNVTGNYISNGNISAAFICFTNSYAGINFRYNNCNGNVSTANVIERQVIGDFKYNSISSVSSKNFEITQSNPNVYSNTFNTSYININNYSSYPCFAPVSNNSSDGGWVWNGGKNNINSIGNGNINFDNGNVLLDWGQNCFLKNQGYNHLWGQIDESSLSYKVRNNDFSNSNIPTTYLFDVTSGYRVYPYSTGSDFGCNNSTDAGTIWLINDLGNGFYDTLYKTSNTSGYQPSQDEVLYSTATQKMILDQNFDAVSYFKSLITGFPGSSYSEACLYSLYSCYQKLDTSSNQGVRDILYTDLKNYLDGRILTGLYSDEFNYTAYNITMMCLASIAEYNDAMSGYEFIALYHPEAYTRLLASWDYAEVQQLLNGSGGISSKDENLTDAEYFAKLTKRVNKGINEDPIKKKVKKSFDKVKTEKTSKVEKEAIAKTNDVKSAKLEVAKMNQKDEMMNTKVNAVMRYSRTLQKEEREKMQIEDILFSNKTENKDEIKVNTTVPEVYSLSQNYPNPFNPVTKINFALPKQGYVSLKIYDITGREIQTLVNEVKQAGYYSVDFNGSSLSSGVYFYMIKSGEFVMTKRMVLIK